MISYIVGLHAQRWVFTCFFFIFVFIFSKHTEDLRAYILR